MSKAVNKDNDKAITEMDLDAPFQFGLFQLESPGDEQYTHTIEVYDSMPKYVTARERVTSDLQHAVVERDFDIRGVMHKIKLKPAIIERKTGNVLIYPSVREEIVEDVLRKFAVGTQGQFLDGEAGVLFTLYELEQELKQRGHGYNKADIKEAILVLRGAVLECSDPEGNNVISTNYFPMIGLQSRKDWNKHGKDVKCYVQFNQLVTRSIEQVSFRLGNYITNMKFKDTFARRLAKRLSHHWRQASFEHPYQILMTSMFRNEGRKMSPRGSNNTRTVETALQELIDNRILSSYDDSGTRYDGRKLVDILYKLYPHAEFITAMKKANWVHNKNMKQLDKHVDSLEG